MAEQPRPSLVGLVPASSGQEIPVLSPGRRSISGLVQLGELWAALAGLGLLPPVAALVPGRAGSSRGHPEPRVPRELPRCSTTEGWEGDGCPGEGFGLSLPLPGRCGVEQLLTSPCPCGPSCPALRRRALQGCPGPLPGLAPCSHAALSRCEPMLSSTNLFFRNIGGKGADQRLRQHSASPSPIAAASRQRAALLPGCAQRGLRLHRRLISVAGEGTPIRNRARNSRHTHFRSPAEPLILPAPRGGGHGGGNVTLRQESCERQPSQAAPSWRWLLVSSSLRWTVGPHH